MTQSEQLRQYNRWRRGDESLEQPDPTAISDLLENAAYRLDALERALETLQEIANADWRKWEELASPEEFVRWAKARAIHALSEPHNASFRGGPVARPAGNDS